MKEFAGYKKGVNLGGWLSQCDNRDYSERHFAEFITEKDFDDIKAAGLDHVRLPFDYNVIMTDGGEFLETGFKYLDFCLDECEKRGLNVVLDLHKTAGFVFDDAEYCDFFESEPLQELFDKLWREMAKRYGKRKNAVFELLNEVTESRFADKWNEIAARTLKSIREYTDIRVMYGGIRNNSILGLTLLDKPEDDNVVFDFHCYSPLVFTHQNAYWVPPLIGFNMEYPKPEKEITELTRNFFGNTYDDEFDTDNSALISSDYFTRLFGTAIEISEKYGVPLYCGEYGVIDQASPESALNWFKDIHKAFEELGISRAVWNYKQKDFGITDEHYAGVKAELFKLL